MLAKGNGLHAFIMHIPCSFSMSSKSTGIHCNKTLKWLFRFLQKIPWSETCLKQFIILSEELAFNPTVQTGIWDHLGRWQMGLVTNPLILSSIHFHKCQHAFSLVVTQNIKAKRNLMQEFCEIDKYTELCMPQRWSASVVYWKIHTAVNIAMQPFERCSECVF